MQKYSKLSLIYFLVIVLSAVFYVLIAIFLHDPLQVWHSPFFRKEITYVDNIRESAKAMIRNQEFDSVIIGNSHSENTSCKEAEKILGGKFINLSITGSTPYEKSLILDYLLKRKKIKQVFYLLDENYAKLYVMPPNYDVNQYSFLYNDNFLDDFKIYFNNKYFLKTIKFSNSQKCIGKVLDMDRPYAWDNKEFHTMRFGGFDVWLKCKDNIQLRAYLERLIETPVKINDMSLSIEYKKKLSTYLNKYLLNSIEKHPDVKFYLIISPVSNIEMAARIRYKEQFFEKQKQMLMFLVQESDKYKNFRIFAFNDDANLCKFEDYKDGTHYRTWINYHILKSIKNNKNELTKENINEYIDNIYKKSILFDFEYYRNKINDALK